MHKFSKDCGGLNSKAATQVSSPCHVLSPVSQSNTNVGPAVRDFVDVINVSDQLDF